MAHIALSPDLPGILGPLKQYPSTAQPLSELAELLLQRESPTFSMAERELVASYVSWLNQCVFCSESHGAVADSHKNSPGWAREVWQNPGSGNISERLRALMHIAAKVQRDARTVSTEDVTKARQLGAADSDIHDTVLIAAAFCMYNRYVDGLATQYPERGHPAYKEMGANLAVHGYLKAVL